MHTPIVRRSAPRAALLLLPALLILAALQAVPAAIAPAAAQPEFAPDPNLPRDQVPDRYKWRTADIYPGDAAWERDVAAFEERLPVLAGYRGRLGESADLLHRCLEDIQATRYTLRKIYVYANLIFDADQGVGASVERRGRASMLFPRFAETIAYVEPELLALDEATVRDFLAGHEGLRTYDWYLQDLLRQKAHALGPAEERIMALAGNVRGGAGDVYAALTYVDLVFDEIVGEDGEPVRLTQSGFPRLRSSASYNVRRQAARTFFRGFRGVQNSLAATLDTHVKGHIMTKEARGYDSCLEAALDPDNISTDAYLMLIATVNEHLPRTLHRYMALRRKVLGLDGPVTFPDLYNPLVAAATPEYDYEACRELILTALEPLGGEYGGLLREGLAPESGWIDLYPNLNKESGAYSNGTLSRDVHPYIKMNYDRSLDNVSTLAHELGHALHSIHSRRAQPPVYGDYVTFIAEVASNVNEELLLNRLLRDADDPDLRLFLLNQRLEALRTAVFRQTKFAEFELRIHEHAEAGNPLTADFLNGLYAELVRTYYGPDFAMGEDEEVEWAYISHYYRNFYVFSYATGLISAISLARQIEDGGQRVADRYIDNLLRAGSSAPPLEILERAGVDLESPRPILDMLDLFTETVDEFDALWTRTHGRS